MQYVITMCFHSFNFDVKVIDFGIAKLVNADDPVKSGIVIGTIGYQPPEMLFDETYDIRGDIFTLGIAFCVMVGRILILHTVDVTIFS